MSANPSPLATVPDAIEPVVGYRAWRVQGSGDLPQLVSLFRPTRWPYREPVSAWCIEGDHPSPSPDCECGVYGLWVTGTPSLNAAAIALYQARVPLFYASPRTVVGLVHGWGLVGKAERGFRAQHAAVGAIIGGVGVTPELLRRVSTLYDVPQV